MSPDDVIGVDGSGAVMDIMGAALLNPSDAFICIIPCYNSFTNNFSLRSGGVMYRADTTANKCVWLF